VPGAEDFLTDDQRKVVAEVISQAEKATSGEIRVHIEDHIEEDVLDHAAYIFEELGMHNTRERNGILIYVCVADRLVAVLGDKGINEKVPDGFWDGRRAVRSSAYGGRAALDLLPVAYR